VPERADAASLGTLDGPDVVYLDRVNGNMPRHDIDRRPGRRIRAYGAALGHVQLAFLPEARQIAILESAERVKLSERTLTDLDALLERLRRVRAQGYAVSDGENAYGLRTVAAPVLDVAGAPVAGVSLTIDADRMPLDAFVEQARPDVLRVAGELTRAMRHSAGTIRVGAP
jgi:IclR family pca regulon transcriptional regulator